MVEHDERLHKREEIADQHAVDIMDLQSVTRRHTQNFIEVQEQFGERQRTRDALVENINRHFEQANQRIDKDEMNLNTFKDATANRLAIERKQTLGDVSALEKRAQSNLNAVKHEVQDNEKDTVARFQGLRKHADGEIARVEIAFQEKLVKLDNSVDRQNRALRKNIEENLKNTQKEISETAENAAENLRTAKQDLIVGQKSFETEVNKKVDVFKNVIKGLGPEIEEMVVRCTYDLIKGQHEDQIKKVEHMIADKVGNDVLRQELAKKADSLALGAYTKKNDANTIVSNAMNEHAKQVEIFLMNTILDNPKKSSEAGGPDEGGGGEVVGYDAKMRMLHLENYCMKNSECINDLYKMLKELNETVDNDARSVHYKKLRAPPSKYISAKTLTPVSDAHGASLGYPNYVSKLALSDKLSGAGVPKLANPEPPGGWPNSARSAMQGWGGSNSDRSHYTGVIGGGIGGITQREETPRGAITPLAETPRSGVGSGCRATPRGDVSKTVSFRPASAPATRSSQTLTQPSGQPKRESDDEDKKQEGKSGGDVQRVAGLPWLEDNASQSSVSSKGRYPQLTLEPERTRSSDVYEGGGGVEGGSGGDSADVIVLDLIEQVDSSKLPVLCSYIIVETFGRTDFQGFFIHTLRHYFVLFWAGACCSTHNYWARRCRS